MKRIVEDKNAASHLEGLMGEKVTIFCLNYIYAGTLTSLNDVSLELSDASIVYKPGELNAVGFKDALRLPNNWHVPIQAIESFGRME